jgi:bile acid-coenzyme A ligase
VRGFADVLGRLADEMPGRPAIRQLSATDAPSCLTFTQLHAAARSHGHALAALGVGTGDLVINTWGNHVLSIVTNFAAWAVGACPLPVDERLPQDDLEAVADLVGALALAGPRHVAGVPTLDCVDLDGPPLVTPAPLPPRWKAMLTSGTTSVPRVVVTETPAQWTNLGDTVYGRLGMAPGQRQLVFSSLSHNMGFDMAHLGLLAGHELILPGPVSSNDFLPLVADLGVEFVGVPPHVLQDNVHQLEHLSRPPRLQAVKHSGARCPVDVKRAWIDWLGPQRLFEAYGMTEGYGRTVIRGDEWIRHEGSVGRPWRSKVAIRDEHGRDLPPGESGQIYFKDVGGHRSCVFGGPAGQVSFDGFRPVGDHGRLSEDGYLYVLGRSDRVVQVHGLNVSLERVELAILSHESVSDCYVDLSSDGVLSALVETCDLALKESSLPLRRHCLRRLAPYEVPLRLVLVNQIPRNAAGKHSRHDARAMIG